MKIANFVHLLTTYYDGLKCIKHGFNPLKIRGMFSLPVLISPQ